MDTGLKGKAALITGSTSGIGIAYARALAAEGCDIMLNGLGDPKEIETVRTSLESDFGVKAGFHPADMTKPAEIREMVKSATETLGKVDILVNNAGIQHRDPIQNYPEETWDRMMAINVTAAFHAIKHAIPQMYERNWGRIVNTSSALGIQGGPNVCAYVASKHAIAGLTKAVAIETANTGITCNAICPGTVRTPMNEFRLHDYMQEHGINDEEQGIRAFLESKGAYNGAMLRYVKAEELAAALVYLCSESAAAVRGVLHPVDGAWNAR